MENAVLGNFGPQGGSGGSHETSRSVRHLADLVSCLPFAETVRASLLTPPAHDQIRTGSSAKSFSPPQPPAPPNVSVLGEMIL
jgi:hypothetical protein